MPISSTNQTRADTRNNAILEALKRAPAGATRGILRTMLKEKGITNGSLGRALSPGNPYSLISLRCAEKKYSDVFDDVVYVPTGRPIPTVHNSTSIESNDMSQPRRIVVESVRDYGKGTYARHARHRTKVTKELQPSQRLRPKRYVKGTK